MRFESKEVARQHVWDTLQEEGIARFPFPPHGRIPNFRGSREAAEALLAHVSLDAVEAAKVNPDSPQRPLRELLLAAGVTVHVPTPRLKGGFKALDPARIPADQHKTASALSNMDRYAEPVPLDRLPQMDLIVAGSVAVTPSGHRAGKGEGYSDIEFAILQELGHAPAPVVTTVHETQIVDHLPSDPTDVPLSLIATPERAIEVENPPPAPTGIHWDLLPEQRIHEMPILRDLRSRRT